MDCIEALILETRPEGPDGCVLTFDIPPLKQTPLPGQFFMVRLLDSGFPLFGRALAVMDYTEAPNAARVGFLVKAVGRGTKMLKEARAGDKALLVGPAGNCFPSLEPDRSYLFVAGGTGVAAFLFLLASPGQKDLLERKQPKLLYGARDRSTLYLRERLRHLPADVLISTEDGSVGKKGLVTALLEDEFEDPGFQEDSQVFVCGPDPMMRAVTDLCRKKDLDVFLSLEVRMACGIGICNGCAVEVVRNHRRSFERVCYEGPVYPAHILPAYSEEGEGEPSSKNH